MASSEGAREGRDGGFEVGGGMCVSKRAEEISGVYKAIH